MATKGKEWDAIPPCGMYCGECRAHLEGECGGCRSGQGIAASFAKECKIKVCADGKDIMLCIECKEFPCQHMDYFKAKRLRESAWYVEIMDNMRLVSESGTGALKKRKDALVKKRKKCAEKKGVKFCNECKDWPCETCRNVPLISEPDVPP